MSKAEEKSLIAYPKKIEWVGNQWDGAPFDVNSESRVAYKQGYHQAEKDLELTLEDLATIEKLCDDFIKQNQTSMSDEEFYKEILKRFRELKKVVKQNKE